MQIHQLKPKTKRKDKRYVGRGGKKGTFSGGGSKGQRSRAGASIKPGFRGGDNRIWQLFPKQRGASKKPGGSGNDGPHQKHRYFIFRKGRPVIVNLDAFDQFKEGSIITPAMLKEIGAIDAIPRRGVKVLGDGNLEKKLSFEGFVFSNSAREKVLKAGGTIK